MDIFRSKEIATLQEKIRRLEEENRNFLKQIEKLEAPRKELLFILDDAVPKDQNGRKKYMGDVALFYTSTFKEKLKHFIGEQMRSLSKFGRGVGESDDVLRANINCFNLIDEWMEKCTNEHLGNLTEMRNSFGDGKKFISELKKTYDI